MNKNMGSGGMGGSMIARPAMPRMGGIGSGFHGLPRFGGPSMSGGFSPQRYMPMSSPSGNVGPTSGTTTSMNGGTDVSSVPTPPLPVNSNISPLNPQTPQGLAQLNANPSMKLNLT